MLTPAAAYIRVSSVRQDEYSPDSQLKLIRAYAAKNEYFIPEEYVFYDDGISAAHADKRNQFNDMIGLAKEKDPPFKVILVWKFSRFARNQEESIVFKNMLKRNGVQVISVSEPIPEDAFGGLIERIIEWMDEYYLIRLSPEVRRGMAEKASRGETMCAAPFGYTFNKTTKIYEPHPTEAPAVVDIFQSYAAGEGMKAIAVRLTNAGFRSKRGNPLDNRGIEYILKNPVYRGMIRWSPEGRKASKRDFDADGVIIVPGKHKALIDDELWRRVQDRYAEQKQKYRRYQRSEPTNKKGYMLRGLIRCSNCGATLIRTTTDVPSLQCHNYARGSCHVSHSVTVAKANRFVIDALEQIVTDKTVPIVPSAIEHAPSELPDFQKLLHDLDVKFSRLSEAYLSGVYELDVFKMLKSQLDAERTRLLAEKEKAEALIDSDLESNILRARISSILPVLKDATVSEEAKNSALRTILTSVTYDRPHSRVDLHFYT